MKMTKTQNNVLAVLARIEISVREDESSAEMYAETLEQMLSDINERDGFGTEGQDDPRGDFRNGEWSMWNVEDVTP